MSDDEVGRKKIERSRVEGLWMGLVEEEGREGGRRLGVDGDGREKV